MIDPAGLAGSPSSCQHLLGFINENPMNTHQSKSHVKYLDNPQREHRKWPGLCKGATVQLKS